MADRRREIDDLLRPSARVEQADERPILRPDGRPSTVSASLPGNYIDLLEQIADETRQSRAAVMRDAIGEYLARYLANRQDS